MDKYEVVFIGGSAFSCGGAFSRGERAVILERGIALASEFTLTLNKTKMSVPTTENGAELYNTLSEKGLLKNGAVHLPPVSDVFAEMTAKIGCRAFLDCEIIGIDKKEDIYEISFFSCDGENTIYAENIIDTTDKGLKNSGEQYITGQFLCGAVLGSTENLTDGKNYFFVRGLFSDEIIFVCKIPPLTDYHTARIIFHEEWKQAHINNPNLRLISQAQKMSYEYAKNAEIISGKNYKWIPSGRFCDIMKAFEEGIRWNL